MNIMKASASFVALAAVVAAVFGARDYFTAEMDQRHAEKTVESSLEQLNKKLDAQSAQSTAQAATLLITVKNLQRGRRASYDNVPEEELTPREKQDRLIIDYDLQNLETIEKAAGLEVPQ